MSIKIQYCLLGLLLAGTAIVTSNFFELGMAILTTFVLAYLTKGSRRNRPSRGLSTKN